MFGRRYKPSLANNNKCKDEIVNLVGSFLYKNEKDLLSNEDISSLIKEIKQRVNELDHKGSSKDDSIERNYLEIKKYMKHINENYGSVSTTRLKEWLEEINFQLKYWSDLIDGQAYYSKEDFSEEKISPKQKKINEKLIQLEEMKNGILNQEKRIEADILTLEKEKEEYESQMMDEENARKLNMLDRKITSCENSIASLNNRAEQYSTIGNLLSIIYVNAKELATAGEYSSAELDKANVFLNISKLQDALTNPERALSVLKAIQKDLDQIKEEVKTVDSKVNKVITQSKTEISDSAMKRKKELLEKKRQKELLDSFEITDINNEEVEVK
ncbi:MAG: hypothetical protein SOY31_04015 [Bacilli bacterium]|nr:hypothetical protein [Bacilli bacterium]MDY4156140.1 hypothetical protein [Bacilli bacterium]